MASYSHWNWKCPYFRWDKKTDLYCEAGILKFKDAERKKSYAAAYCCSLNNWETCSLATALSRFYEKESENE